MPPRLNLLAAPRSLAFRPKPVAYRWRTERIAAATASPVMRRGYADGGSRDLPTSTEKKGPNTDTLPHVSEEARDMANITGTTAPEVEQGTPVDEVVKGDEEAEKHLPKVMKDSLKAASSTPKGSRSYSTSPVHRAEMEVAADPAPTEMEVAASPALGEMDAAGLRFGVVPYPMPAGNRLKSRYDPVIDQFTKLLMWDGKLSVAQRHVAAILNFLRTSSPPTINPARPLLPGSPPPSHLPLNPILYLTLAIDSIAPLLRLRSQRGLAGGGVALQLPVPLSLRQRRRTATEWILQAAAKRKSKGSGRNMLAAKIADEIIAVVQGTSTAWTRREGIHKVAVAARANLKPRGKGKR